MMNPSSSVQQNSLLQRQLCRELFFARMLAWRILNRATLQNVLRLALKRAQAPG